MSPPRSPARPFRWPHALEAPKPDPDARGTVHVLETERDAPLKIERANAPTARVRALFAEQPPQAQLTVRDVMRLGKFAPSYLDDVEDVLRKLVGRGELHRAKTADDPRTAHKRWAYSRERVASA